MQKSWRSILTVIYCLQVTIWLHHKYVSVESEIILCITIITEDQNVTKIRKNCQTAKNSDESHVKLQTNLTLSLSIEWHH